MHASFPKECYVYGPTLRGVEDHFYGVEISEDPKSNCRVYPETGVFDNTGNIICYNDRSRIEKPDFAVIFVGFQGNLISPHNGIPQSAFVVVPAAIA
jgi:hypothetical protein